MTFDGFSDEYLPVNGVTIHVRARRHPRPDASALLLLHGFPQSHYLWRKVVDRLGQEYSLVCPDLRGYGDSEKPAGLADHSNYSKRMMARDMAELMSLLGHHRFAVVGHDRGGRVAHRLALDHASRVSRMCLLDISPTLTMYERTDMAFASAYFHWFFLIQPQPIPEMMMAGCAPELVRTFLGRWGADVMDADETAIVEYQRCWANPAGLHGSCEDYRAAASIDLEHDRESDRLGVRLDCPLLVLWGQHGVIHRLFEPLADWQAKSRSRVTGQALAAGHYLPEEIPMELLEHLVPFLAG